MAKQDIIPAGVDTGAENPTGLMPGQERFGIDDVTPEEQAQYDRLVKQFAKFAYGEKNGSLIRQMNDKQTPVYKNVADATVMLMNSVVNVEEQNTEDISPDAVFFATAEATTILMDLGDQAGIWPFKQKSEQYTKQQEMAFIESQKLIGEDMLQRPEREQLRAEAQDNAATRIGMESESGNLDPRLQDGIRGMTADPRLDTSAPNLQTMGGGEVVPPPAAAGPQGAPQAGAKPGQPGFQNDPHGGPFGGGQGPGGPGGPQQTPVAQGVQQAVGRG
jgi:hypothetical protein